MKSLDGHPSVPPLPFAKDLKDYFETETKKIVPSFPNWEKSFVSGTQGTLFEVDHRIDSINFNFLFTQIHFQPGTEGPPGHVHGGATAGLIDELMGIALWHNQYKGMTQTLQVFYWKAVPLHDLMYGVTEVVKVGPKKLEVRSTIFDHKKTPYVSAQGVFYHLTQEQLDRFKLRPTGG